MGFMIQADSSTTKVMKDLARRGEQETKEYWAFLDAFTGLVEAISQQALEQDKR